MKFLLTTCLILMNVLYSFSQKNIDIGAFAGISYYQGDINAARQFYRPHFAYGALLRFNYGYWWAVKTGITSGGLSGDDRDFPKYRYQKILKRSFFTPLVDISGQVDLHFMPYKTGDKKRPFTPYVHAGAVFFIASYAYQPYQFGIPFGLGIKFNVVKSVSMGLEWSFRKTFTDGLDKIQWYKDIPTTSFDNSYLIKKQSGYSHQNDWYSFLGLFLTFRIKPTGMECQGYN